MPASHVSVGRNPVARETMTEHLLCLSESVFVEVVMCASRLSSAGAQYFGFDRSADAATAIEFHLDVRLVQKWVALTDQEARLSRNIGWPCLMTRPGVSCFTSSRTGGWATASAGNFKVAMPKSRRGVIETNKTRGATKLLFTRSPSHQCHRDGSERLIPVPESFCVGF